MIAADIMTHPVLAIDPQATLLQAIRLMTEHKVSGLPVVAQNGQLVGMITERDLLCRVETGTEGERRGWLISFLTPGRDASRYVATHGRRVEEVMTPGVYSVTEGTPLSEVVELMQKRGVKRLPVVRAGRLLGIVSRADLVRRVGAALEAAASHSADDAGIRTAILEAIRQERWAPANMVTVAVQGGVVQLDGCLFDLRERDALGVVAENIDGVKRVENRIVCIEPQTGMVTYDPAGLAA